MVMILKICLFNQTKPNQSKPSLISNIFPDAVILKSTWISFCGQKGGHILNLTPKATTQDGLRLKLYN